MTKAPSHKMASTKSAKHIRRPPARAAATMLGVAAIALSGCGSSDDDARCEGRYQAASGAVEFSYRAQSSLEVLLPGEVEGTGVTSSASVASWIHIRDAGPTFVVLTSMPATVGDGAWVAPEFTEFCADNVPVFVNELSSDDDAALEVLSADGTTHDVTLSKSTKLARGQVSTMQFPEMPSNP